MQGGRAFWPVLTLVLLGHGAVLTLLTTTPPHGARGVTVPPLRVFQVRPVQPPPPQEAPSPQPPPAVAPSAAPTPSPSPPAQAPAPQPQVAAPVAAPPPDPPYLPRGELTEPPRLLASVDVPFPPSVGGVVDLRVQVTLFIDEQGIVQRVRVDTPGVHPVFELSILESFSQARFKPGEVDAVAVRSQVRVEVEFHSPGRRRR